MFQSGFLVYLMPVGKDFDVVAGVPVSRGDKSNAAV
jgi:hypothetical protein